MDLKEYAAHDGLGLAALVRDGQISPRELAETARRAIETVNPSINAVVEIYEDCIADLDEGRLGDGPFRGVPFLMKDIGEHLKGRKTEYGSRLAKGIVSEADTFYGMMLRQSGVNFIGRTNTPEFSMASSAENLLYGATHNPWKRGHSTGGSTGGGAAAVAAGMAPLAHGSDIGGSIRQPASWCGGIGLKPSRGMVSRGPFVDESGFGMAATFVQSRTMRDTAVMLDCLSKPQPGDPFVVSRSPKGFAAHLEKVLRPYRIAWWNKPLMDEPVDGEVARAVEATAQTLRDLGHVVEEARPDFDLLDIDRTCAVIWYWGFDEWLDGLARRTGRTIGPDTLERTSLNAYEHAKRLTCDALMTALDNLNRIRRQTGGFFRQYDIWLTPTTAHVAPPLGQYNMNKDMPVEEFIIREERTSQFMVLFNATGQPAISLPLAMHSSGLPIGIQLAARPSEDHILIELGVELERAMPWRDRRPTAYVGG